MEFLIWLAARKAAERAAWTETQKIAYQNTLAGAPKQARRVKRRLFIFYCLASIVVVVALAVLFGGSDGHELHPQFRRELHPWPHDACYQHKHPGVCQNEFR
jgi:hypothetical protein